MKGAKGDTEHKGLMKHAVCPTVQAPRAQALAPVLLSLHTMVSVPGSPGQLAKVLTSNTFAKWGDTTIHQGKELIHW